MDYINKEFKHSTFGVGVVVNQMTTISQLNSLPRKVSLTPTILIHLQNSSPQ